jgi:putative heme-binding domain-containing protein
MRLALCSSVLLTLALATPKPSAAQSATDVAEGKKLFGGLCVTCHGFDGAGGAGPPLNRPRLLSAPDDTALRAIIADGIPNKGMPRVRRVTDDEMRQLVAYVRSIGKVARTPVRGDAPRGGQLYAKLGCSGCHIINGAGGSLGPELTNIGVLRGPDYLRQAVLEPAARLPKDNLAIPARGYNEFLPVTVVLRDGAEVRGIRLNEDVFTIQLRDASGKFHSVRKSDAVAIRKETGASLMPSYANRLVGGEIDDLVAYLSRLGGAL